MRQTGRSRHKAPHRKQDRTGAWNKTAVCTYYPYKAFRNLYIEQLKTLEAILGNAAARGHIRAVRTDVAAFTLCEMTRGLIVQRLFGWSPELIRAMDAERARYVRLNFDQDWADQHLYDLLVSSNPGEEATASIILAAMGAGQA